MFADDTSISISGRSLADLQTMINCTLENINCWLRANRLSLNVAKTEFMIIGTHQRTLAKKKNVSVQKIIQLNHIRLLGFTIDDWLSGTNPITKVCEKVFGVIGALKRNRPFVTAMQNYNVLFPVKTIVVPSWMG